jgi:hypothetical protein
VAEIAGAGVETHAPAMPHLIEEERFSEGSLAGKLLFLRCGDTEWLGFSTLGGRQTR